MITCQICQHENPAGAEYCEDCGASLAVSATPPPAPAPAPSPPDSPPTPVAASPDADAAPPAAPSDVAATSPAPSDATATTGQTEPLTPDAVPDAVPDPLPASPTATTPPAAPAAGTGLNPRLVGVRYGAPTGEEHPLLGIRLVVGRFDPETGPVDVDLSASPEAVQISRHHAELSREVDGRWFVKDLGSTNGVFVKSAGSATFGPRITEPRALTSGDEVAFGNARFIFQTD